MYVCTIMNLQQKCTALNEQNESARGCSKPSKSIAAIMPKLCENIKMKQAPLNLFLVFVVVARHGQVLLDIQPININMKFFLMSCSKIK